MHTGKQKQMNFSYEASLVNRHIRRFTGEKGSESSFNWLKNDFEPPAKKTASDVIPFEIVSTD